MLVVFGATGFLGRHVVADAVRLGLSVRAVSRENRLAAPASGIEWAFPDFDSQDAVDALIHDGDSVLNLAFARGENENLQLLEALLGACIRKRAAVYVHCSTAVVAGNTPSPVVSEETPCMPNNAYEHLKLTMEQKVSVAARAGLPTVIVRPTAIVGPGGANLLSLALSLASGLTTSNYLRACLFGDRPMHLVPVTTVAAAILYLASAPERFAGETFIVAADEDPDNRFPAVERLLAASLGLPPRRLPVVPVPRNLLSAILRFRGRSDLAGERAYSSDKLRAAGFASADTVAQAVAEFGSWFRREMGMGRRQTISPSTDSGR